MNIIDYDKNFIRLLLNPFLEGLGLLNNLVIEKLGLLTTKTKERYLRNSTKQEKEKKEEEEEEESWAFGIGVQPMTSYS